MQELWVLAADTILAMHVVVVVFIVFGLFLIYVGCFLKWSWVRNFWFRIVHLVSIGIVVVQSWMGEICPLTTWEMALRERAGQATYSGSFIQHWMQYILYYDAPGWVFSVCYTLFGCLVFASWFVVRPNRYL
ncbi:DUF2784 domain-containing protein [Marinobacterium arenosum]|uniref:DUF2784 domain-containing protein n=1 Tax=Marinobacterium arenosum TaxID=2862496 RepID=UPI0028F3E8A2|nr:DUF2784 domain-containing protein [Marinobacterium arenosum]